MPDAGNQEAIRVILEAFAAVEGRDDARLAGVCDPAVEFCWPESLQTGRTYEQTWDPFQPSERERAMSPRVVAATEDEVAVIWHQRGVNANGDRFDQEVFGLYRLRGGVLVRAQMFYFDSAAVKRFLGTNPPTPSS